MRSNAGYVCIRITLGDTHVDYLTRNPIIFVPALPIKAGRAFILDTCKLFSLRISQYILGVKVFLQLPIPSRSPTNGAWMVHTCKGLFKSFC